MVGSHDRYCRQPVVHHDAVFGVMGAPLRFQTNSARLFTLAVEAFARFGPPTREAPLITMRLFAHHVDTSLPQHVWPLITRGQDDYHYVAWGPGSTLTADMGRGFIYGFLSPDVEAWPDLTREAFLIEPVYYTLTRHEYVPLHVAIVLWRGRFPLYLVPEGKTDLAPLLYAAARSGWRLVAERLAMAVRTPRGWHFWGVPWWLHLPQWVSTYFPELEMAMASPQGNGEWRIIVDVEDMWPGSTEPHAGPGPLVLVHGNTGTADYDWMDASDLLARVELFSWQEEAWILDGVHDVTEYLADQGTYWLTLDDDPEHSLAILDELGERHWRL